MFERLGILFKTYHFPAEPRDYMILSVYKGCNLLLDEQGCITTTKHILAVDLRSVQHSTEVEILLINELKCLNFGRSHSWVALLFSHQHSMFDQFACWLIKTDFFERGIMAADSRVNGCGFVVPYLNLGSRWSQSILNFVGISNRNLRNHILHKGFKK